MRKIREIASSPLRSGVLAIASLMYLFGPDLVQVGAVTVVVEREPFPEFQKRR